MVSSDYNSALVSSLVPLSIACSKAGKWQEAGWGRGNGANLVVRFLWQSCAIVLFVLHLLHYPWYWVDLTNILTSWSKDWGKKENLQHSIFTWKIHTPLWEYKGVFFYEYNITWPSHDLHTTSCDLHVTHTERSLTWWLPVRSLPPGTGFWGQLASGDAQGWLETDQEWHRHKTGRRREWECK